MIIGADGIHSAVARALFGRAHDPARVALALEVELPGPASDGIVLDLSALPWGYGWDFPKDCGRTIGAGAVAARVPDMPAAFRAWLKAQGHDPAALRIRGHHLPMGEFRSVPGQGRVLLTGDAAGLVDPITGEGIGWAVHSGRMAAEAAALAVQMGAPGHALELYRLRADPMLRELRRARLLSRLVYSPALRPMFLDALARSPSLRRRYLDLLAGDLDYADVGFLRLARFALRLAAGGKA